MKNLNLVFIFDWKDFDKNLCELITDIVKMNIRFFFFFLYRVFQIRGKIL